MSFDMTPQQIKDGAPDGATHWGLNDNYSHIFNYFKIINGVIYHWCGFDWLEMIDNELTEDIKPL